MNLNNWFTCVIPMLSLFISFYSIWRTRKNITVNFSPNVIALPLDSIHTLNKNGERDFHYHKALLTYVEIVNSSPIDISYFDLRVFDTVTNINIDFVTRWTIPSPLSKRELFNDYSENRYYKLDIPERKFGNLPANSFTRMDIVIVLDLLPKEIKNLETIGVSFKVPKKTYVFHDPYAATNRNKFKVYGIKYDVSPLKLATQK